MGAKSTDIQPTEPQPELGPAMRALPPRWQKAATGLFITKGNRSAARRMAGFSGTSENANAEEACRMFQDPRMRAAIRELAAQMIETSEPELLATTFEILRDATQDAKDRLMAVRLIWDRARPLVTQHKVEVEHHLSSDELDQQHYRALQRLGAPMSAFLARFGHNGLARVQAMIVAEDARQKQIGSSAGTIDGEYEEVADAR
jgi:hypothetical protein